MHLRQKLLMHLREEGDQIAPIVVVLISKIAHSDYHKGARHLFGFITITPISRCIIAKISPASPMKHQYVD